MQTETTTEAQPTLTAMPAVTHTAILVPADHLAGADSLMLYVQSKNGGVIDMLKFVRRGNSFVLNTAGGGP